MWYIYKCIIKSDYLTKNESISKGIQKKDTYLAWYHQTS